MHDTVYVSARKTNLHDRVAAVSNRVGEVTNGEPLEVLERGRRFIKVKTPKNEIGWLEEHTVIDSNAFKAFQQLATDHKTDTVVATAVIRDDIYLHLTPGRDTERFYLLAANAKVQLLARASVPKAASNTFRPPLPPKPPKPSSQNPASQKPTTAAKEKPTAPESPKQATAAAIAGKNQTAASGSSASSHSQSAAKKLTAVPASAATALPQPEPPPMEDWWLVRDGQGRTGWLLAGRLDVDVPEEIAVYAEGQRMVGAYLLNKIFDSEANTPNHEVGQYVTVLSPPRSGLPFDFDQVRVFIWSLKRHRYETAYRLHPIQGFLPLKVVEQAAPGGSAPVFSFQIANNENLTINSATGIARPTAPRTVSFALVENQVKRTGPDQGPITVPHTGDAKPKPSTKKAKAYRKR
jgi:hypothetical protein